MKRLLWWVVWAGLFTALLTGCGAAGEAGGDPGDGRAGRDAAARAGASPEVVDPQEVGPQSQAAGETPSILGSTPETGQAGVWERRKLWETWDIGYPDGWQVEEAGDRVVLTGPYGEQQYRVEIAQPAGVTVDDLAEWAEADLAALNQPSATLAKLSTTEVQAMKVANLTLEEASGSCPAVRVYGQGRTGETMHRIVITVTQIGGDSHPENCEATNIQRLADALMAEAHP